MKKIITILAIGISLVGCGKEDPMKERVYGNQVGAYEYKHLVGSDKVFLLVTPRGPEYVKGVENLQNSLDIYREQGVYGKDYREL